MMEPSAGHTGSLSAQGRVALLESDAERRGTLSVYLRDAGFEVLALQGPEELAPAVEGGPLDLLLIGGEHAEPRPGSPIAQARGMHHGDRLPIVLMPDLSAAESAVDWTAADVVLARPFQLGQLARAIEALRGDGLFRRPAPERSVAASDLRPPLRVRAAGDLDDRSFGEVFRGLWEAAYTGSIGLKSGSTWRRIELLNGFPIAAQSNLLTEHLLRYLLRLGYITPDAYRQLLPTAQDQEWQDGSGALPPETLDPERWHEARLKLAEEIILHCFKWRGATYQLRDDRPVAADAALDLNPFSLYVAWLADPSEAVALNRAFAPLQNRELTATPAAGEHAHLLRPLLEQLPHDVARFEEPVTGAHLAQLLGGKERSRAVVVALVDLEILQPAAAVAKAGASPPNRAEAAPVSRRKFERIRQMVEEDQGRVLRARSPYGVLGLAESATAEEVRARYLRFSRFYRPENFERIGDPELVDAAQEILGAFGAAATSILGEEPEGPPIAPARRAPTLATLSQDDLVLAEVFFDDGSTYVRLGDWEEAHAHFQRAHQLSRNTPRYMTMLGWCNFQLGRRDAERVRQAKDLLLAALKLDSRNDRALYYLGCIYEENGRIDRATECWKKALRLNASNFEARAAIRRNSTKR